MKCPYCGSLTNKVVDKRGVIGSGEIRRRRECLKCFKRFTTYEKVVAIELIVIKKDGRREIFEREKLRSGIAKALEKRPAMDQVDSLTDKIEMKIRNKDEKEISSKMIGQMVLTELKKLDTVAYVRFVSVYRQFKHLEDFTKEVEHLN